MTAVATDRETGRDRFFLELEDRYRDHAIVAKAIAVLRTRGNNTTAIIALLKAITVKLEREES